MMSLHIELAGRVAINQGALALFLRASASAPRCRRLWNLRARRPLAIAERSAGASQVIPLIVPTGLAFTNFVILAIVVAALYFTRDILVPIALAGLLSFLLAPLVRRLQAWRVPRAVAVMCAVLAALMVAGSLATMVMVEVGQLVNDLPRYQATLGSKVRHLHDAVADRTVLKNASSMLKHLDRELSTKESSDPPAKETLSKDRERGSPIPVEVHQPDPGASETLMAVLTPLVAPFTTTGIVVIFLAFF